MPEIHVKATVTDAHDGLCRLLADVARLGFELTGVTLETMPDNSRVALRFNAGTMETASIEARLSRHPTVIRLETSQATANAGAQRKDKDGNHG